MRQNVMMPTDHAGSDVKMECHGTTKPFSLTIISNIDLNVLAFTGCNARMLSWYQMQATTILSTTEYAHCQSYGTQLAIQSVQ
jgi:hypothetical protein